MNGLADFHHIEFRVSNALQASYSYCCCFGFQRFAQRKDDNSTSIAIKNGKVIFVFTSIHFSNKENYEHMVTHGDSVKDVAFRVDDLSSLVKRLVNNNVDIIQAEDVLSEQEGKISIVKIRVKGSTLIHSLIEDGGYHGLFLPNFVPIDNYSLCKILPSIPVILLDHVVQNFPTDTIEDVAAWYDKNLKLQRFWSIDDKITTSEFSAMKAWLITNQDHKVQVTLAEGVKGRKGKNQIEEFVEYNGGPGIQHIALLVDDIIGTVTEMKKRSTEFLTVPETYFDMLNERLQKSKLNCKEDLNKLRELSILMDFDENGYLLQIFTKPLQDRPCLFMEIIQRRNFNGFGAGNFKALFDAVEREQKLRGTLCD